VVAVGCASASLLSQSPRPLKRVFGFEDNVYVAVIRSKGSDRFDVQMIEAGAGKHCVKVVDRLPKALMEFRLIAEDASNLIALGPALIGNLDALSPDSPKKFGSQG
jgi:hypothetical protein